MPRKRKNKIIVLFRSYTTRNRKFKKIAKKFKKLEKNYYDFISCQYKGAKAVPFQHDA